MESLCLLMDIQPVVLVEGNEGIENEVWSPIHRITLERNKEFSGLDLDCIDSLKAYFERLTPGFSCNLDPKSVVEFGSRLWSPDGVIYGYSANHKDGNRASYFVKLCLQVDTNRRNGSKIDNQYRIYFGEAVRFLKYKFPCGRLKLLTLVKIFDFIERNDEPWPYKKPSTPYKIKLINVDEIVAMCGRSVDQNEREYVFWDYKE